MLSFSSIIPLAGRGYSHRAPIFRCRSRNVLTASASGPDGLIIGLNEYSHDTAIAIMEANSGRLRFALAKERLSRRKHDGGDVGILVHHALGALAEEDGTSPEGMANRVELVIANNHHFRIRPFERRLPFQVSLKYVPESYMSPWNLIGSDAPFISRRLAPRAQKIELSHHLAHALSAVYDAPFDRGLVVVMDGMGDALDDWLKAASFEDGEYYHEENLSSHVCCDASYFKEFPVDVRSRPGVSFREAETVYIFERSDTERNSVKFTRVFKRWTPENAPPELSNHSFEEMESLGAIYSRVSAIIFKDWNACGKVMGLAPWAKERLEGIQSGSNRYFMDGDLIDGSLTIDREQLKGLDHLDQLISDPSCRPEVRRYFENLALHVQRDLEDVVSSFILELKTLTSERNLVLAGGVALNSTMNGLLSSSNHLDKVYVPPYPGDEGIAIGCASFGLSYLNQSGSPQFPLPDNRVPSMPYFGKDYSTEEIMLELECFGPWIVWQHADETEVTAKALSESKVVAWFRGRSEFGPRALGNRSLLADPRNRAMIDHLNMTVKKRESFRPFAPSVLGEDVTEWFPCCDSTSSPFMSMTTLANNVSSIEAVVHVDGTSRLQTLSKEHNIGYHRMISHFKNFTGVPMVMNTSFNVAGEPIVESPRDALMSFLSTDGIDMLAFPGIVVRKRSFSFLTKTHMLTSACTSFRSEQVQDDSGECLRTTVCFVPCFFGEDEAIEPACECTAKLTDGLELEILEFIHNRGLCQISEVVNEVVGSFVDQGDSASGAPVEKDVVERISSLCSNRLVFISD